MSSRRWRVHFTRRQQLLPSEPRPLVGELDLPGVDSWLDAQGIDEGVPCLFCPDGGYDIELNSYFLTNPAPQNTHAAMAYDLARFFTFLWCHREPLGTKGWRDAQPEDRVAYQRWRRVEENGPGVKGSTWGREVATANTFYRWAVTSGLVPENPILQRESRSRRRPDRRGRQEQTPAEAPKDGRTEDLAWLPPQSYRRWRDVGVRGYRPDGLRDPSFRGRNATRDALFCDLMVRTGLRLGEQTSLTVFEIPDFDVHRAYAPTWLPSAVAKNGSGRRIYIPATVLRDLWDYIEVDRCEAIELARSRGTYEQLSSALVVDDAQRPAVTSQSGGRKRPVETLTPRQRQSLLVRRPEGLEPAALWLTGDGLPVRPRTWQSMFHAANVRCGRHEVGLRVHPHLLRHTFAVVTLEQLQREHIRELGTMTSEQRTSYEQIFGDPLDWVRRRLGHRSVETTFKYLHTLNELAMETRLALVPEEWDTPARPEPEPSAQGIGAATSTQDGGG